LTFIAHRNLREVVLLVDLNVCKASALPLKWPT